MKKAEAYDEEKPTLSTWAPFSINNDSSGSKNWLLRFFRRPPPQATSSSSVSEPPEYTTKGQRLLDREGRFFQSNGRFNISRHIPWKDKAHFYYYDWFHTLIDSGTKSLVILALVVYYFVLMFFATIYYTVGERCEMQIRSFNEAFFFSLETMMTIGYGTPGDFYFGQCASVLVVVSMQSMTGLFMSAILFGMVFVRLARGQKRAKTIIFGNKAVIRCIRGHFYFMFQVCELRKHQLSEAHVRCYAIRNEYDETNQLSMQPRFMRLQHPDDSIGAPLLLAFPSTVVHRIDAWSPLFPGDEEDDQKSRESSTSPYHDPLIGYLFPEPLQRESDSESGSRDCLSCAVCAQTFPSHIHRLQHQRYNAACDLVSGHGTNSLCHHCGQSMSSAAALKRHIHVEHVLKTSHISGIMLKTEDSKSQERGEKSRERSDTLLDSDTSDVHVDIRTRHPQINHLGEGLSATQFHDKFEESPLLNPQNIPKAEKERIKEFLYSKNIEILVLLEGCDQSTGSTLQVRHSYSYREGDIVFDFAFENCVRSTSKGGCRILFDRFHSLRPAPADTHFAGFVSSHS